MPSPRRIIKLIFTNLVVLLALLAVVEMIFRILGYGYSNSPADPDPVLRHVHPGDYLFKSYSPTGEFGDFMIYYDSLGRRSQLPEKIQTTQTNTRTVAFLGDSFTEALQVPYDSSFTGLLAREFPTTRMLNYGVTGYSPVLHYLQCKKMLYEHKVVPDAVFMVLYSNDVRDDSTYIKGAVYNEPGHTLAGIQGRKANWLHTIGRKSYLARMIRRSMIIWEYQKKHRDTSLIEGVVVHGLLEESPAISNTLTAEYILMTDSLLKKHGIPLYLAVIPSRYKNFTGDSGFVAFSEKVQPWAAANGLQYLSFDSAFSAATAKGERLFYNKDVHCNASGHKAIASVLEPWIQR